MGTKYGFFVPVLIILICRSHLKSGHKKNSRSKSFHDNMILFSQTFYNCKICRAKLNRNRQVIRNHVRGIHQLTFVDYENSYESSKSTSNETTDEIIDNYEDRVFSGDLIGRKVRGNYGDEGWFEGLIAWYNKRAGRYRIHYPDSSEDYITEAEIDGVDLVLLEQ